MLVNVGCIGAAPRTIQETKIMLTINEKDLGVSLPSMPANVF